MRAERLDDHAEAGALARVVIVNDRNLFQPAQPPGTHPPGAQSAGAQSAGAQSAGARPGGAGDATWVPRDHGLAAGVAAGAAACGVPVTFVSSAGIPLERRLASGQAVPVKLGSGAGVLRLASIPWQQYRAFQDQFANNVLWLAHHDALSSRSEADEGMRAFVPGYVAVNESLSRLVVTEVSREPGHTCTVWQDFQLYLAPLIVRRSLPAEILRRHTSVHFVHVPFPAIDTWRLFPAHVTKRLLTGLLGNDAVWFHLPVYAANFIAAVCRHVPGASAEGQSFVRWAGRRIFAGSNPFPPDAAHLRAIAADPRTARHRAEIRALAAGRQIIFSTGRVDPVKGYPRLLRSFAHLLEAAPGDTMLLAQWYRSRTTIPRWRSAATELSQLAAGINDHYQHVRPAPVRLSLEDDVFAAVAGYLEYDVLDATPDADGMNLVSLEGPAINGRSGLLLLSSGAGSSHLYGDRAVTIRPACDPRRHAAALRAVLGMPMADRVAHAARLRAVALSGDPGTWFMRLLRVPDDRPASMENVPEFLRIRP